MAGNNKGIVVGGNFTVNGHFAYGNRNIQQGDINSPTDEINNLIEAVLEASKELSPEEQEEVKEYTDVIQSEVNAKQPKKNMIKTALNGLKKFVSSEKVIDAVTKLVPVILGFIEKLG